MKRVFILVMFTIINSFSLVGQVYEDGDYDGDGLQEKWYYCETCVNQENGELGNWVKISEEDDPDPDPDPEPDPDPTGGGEPDPDPTGGGEPDGNDNDGWDDEWDGDDDDWPDDEWWDDWWENDGSGPNAGGSGLVKKCLKLSSKTFYEPNRSRTIIGIGEEVRISVINNKCQAAIEWKLGPGGGGKLTLDPTDPDKAVFEAGFVPQKVKIIASVQGDCPDCPPTDKDLELEFDIIEPTGVYFDNWAKETTQFTYPNTFHEQFRVSCGYFSDTYLMPDNVNFYKVKIREGEADFEILPNNFYWKPYVNHKSNAFVNCENKVFAGKGTLISRPDRIRINGYCKKEVNPILPGCIQFQIPNFYKREGSPDVEFCKTIQKGCNIGGEANSIFEVSKEQSMKSKKVNDFDSLWPSLPTNLPKCDE